MNKTEITLFKDFLGRLGEHFSNAGCNDYELADTPENRAIYDGVEKMMLEFDPEYKVRGAQACIDRYGFILTQDWLVLDYLEKKVIGILENAIDA